jgi:negative regulator of flagellin synthesis FlgM
MADIKLGAAPPVGTAGARVATTKYSGARTTGETAASELGDSVAAAAATGAQALDAGAPPVDNDRVSLIRKAIADGNYPIIPSRVGDAIIAAGMLVWSSK